MLFCLFPHPSLFIYAIILLCPHWHLLSLSLSLLFLPSPNLQYGGGCSDLRQLWRSGPFLHWQAEQTHCVGSTRQQARYFQPLLWLFPSCKNPALLLFSWLSLTSINSGLKEVCVLLRDASDARAETIVVLLGNLLNCSHSNKQKWIKINHTMIWRKIHLWPVI